MSKFDPKGYVDQLVRAQRNSPKTHSGRAPLLSAGRRERVRANKGPSTYVFLSKLDGLKVVWISLHDSAYADEFVACFIFEGSRFAIDMDWGGELDLVADPGVQDKTFELVLGHLQHTSHSPWQVSVGSMWRTWVIRRRLSRLPNWPPESWFG